MTGADSTSVFSLARAIAVICCPASGTSTAASNRYIPWSGKTVMLATRIWFSARVNAAAVMGPGSVTVDHVLNCTHLYTTNGVRHRTKQLHFTVAIPRQSVEPAKRKGAIFQPSVEQVNTIRTFVADAVGTGCPLSTINYTPLVVALGGAVSKSALKTYCTTLLEFRVNHMKAELVSSCGK